MINIMRLFKIVDQGNCAYIVSAPTKEDAILLLVACDHIPDNAEHCEKLMVVDKTPSIFSAEIVDYFPNEW